MNDKATIRQRPEAERAVIGGCFDSDVLRQASAILDPEDFVDSKNREIYRAMLQVEESGEGVDYLTVIDRMRLNGNEVDYAYLTRLVGGGAGYVSSLNIAQHAEIVRRASAERMALDAAQHVVEQIYSDKMKTAGDVHDLISGAFDGIDVIKPSANIEPIADIAGPVFERLAFLADHQDQQIGIPFGLGSLDRLIGGLQESDFMILAGRPGMGKSAAGVQFAVNAAKKYDLSVALFSLEMSKAQVTQRILASETGIDSKRLRSGNIYDEEWPIITEAMTQITKWPLYIDDTAAVTPAYIRNVCKRMKQKGNLDLIGVDYLQLMEGAGGENRQQEISYISRRAKALAMELGTPIIALSQLSRAVEARANKRPMLSDLRESGALEQDADHVVFVYREDYYIEDTDRQNVSEFIVSKNRHGDTGTAMAYFHKEQSRFSDLEVNRTYLDEQM